MISSYEENQIIGFITSKVKAFENTYIMTFGVAPEHQSLVFCQFNNFLENGFGSALLKTIIAYAYSEKSKALILHV